MAKKTTTKQISRTAQASKRSFSKKLNSLSTQQKVVFLLLLVGFGYLVFRAVDYSVTRSNFKKAESVVSSVADALGYNGPITKDCYKSQGGYQSGPEVCEVWFVTSYRGSQDEVNSHIKNATDAVAALPEITILSDGLTNGKLVENIGGGGLKINSTGMNCGTKYERFLRDSTDYWFTFECHDTVRTAVY